MNFNHLNYFIQASKYGSINKASKILHLTPSALVAALDTIENELGYKLFIRNRQGLSLTENGSLFLNDAKEILRIENNWKAIANNSVVPERISLKLSSVKSVYNSILDSIVIDILDTDASINLIVEEGSIHDVENSLLENSVNFAIQAYLLSEKSLIQTFADNLGYMMQTLYRDEWIVFVGQKNPLYEKDCCTIEELESFTGIAISYQPISKFEHQKIFGRNTLYFDNQMYILKKLTTSDCFSILPAILKHNIYCTSNVIHALPIKDHYYPEEYALLYPRKPSTVKEQLVIDTILSHFKKLED